MFSCYALNCTSCAMIVLSLADICICVHEEVLWIVSVCINKIISMMAGARYGEFTLQ
jgi:hypothetical protein